MRKNYDLYSPYQRTIDNLKRRIRGYEKMKKDLTNQYRKSNKENQELKKQLEEMDSKLFFTKNELEMRQKTIDNKLRQQNEFIEWLEDKLSILNNIIDTEEDEDKRYHALIRKIAYEEILSKYKEI